MVTLNVNEIFRSIQGEGFFTGTPCIFIRLQGCFNNCEFCDTPHAQLLVGGTTKSIWSVVEDVRELRKGTKIDRVVITGGEPFLQSEALLELCYRLHENGLNVSIESAGTVEVDKHIDKLLAITPENKPDTHLMFCVYLTISPKIYPPLDAYVQRADELKMLVAYSEEADIPIPPLALKMLNNEIQGKNTKQFYFQPITYAYEAMSSDEEHTLRIMKSAQDSNLALRRALDLCYKHGANLSVQLHKLLGVQ